MTRIPEQVESEACIVAQEISWSTPDGVKVIDRVSLGFGRQRYSLVGRNGVGKTTLMRLLNGDLRPQSGVVEVRCSLGYLPQQLNPSERSSVAGLLGIESRLRAIEQIEQGSYEPTLFDLIGDEWNLADRAQVQLARLGLGYLDLRQSGEHLSGGEVTRLALARVLLNNPEFLLLDEPTNNLDYGSREYLYECMYDWRGGLLVISHDRVLLNLVNATLLLAQGTLQSHGGNFDFYVAQRGIEDAAATREMLEAQRAHKRHVQEARRARERQERRATAGKKRRGRSGQAKIILGVWKESSQNTSSRLRRVHESRIADAAQHLELARQAIRPDNRLKIDLTVTSVPEGKLVLQLEDVVFRFEPSSEDLFSGLNLVMMGPDRLALLGPNGSGKTTLARLIVGELRPNHGRIVLGVADVGYVPQSSLLLKDERTVLENFALLSEQSEGKSRELLSAYLFFREDVFKTVHNLSGGERIRLALGALLSRHNPPELLIIDEPTNHLDLDSIEQLESALQSYRGALIVISHDRHFIDAIGIARTLVLEGPHS